jgi:hypothetical protein
VKRLSPRWILGAGWLVGLLYAYPGYMTYDAIDELVDSRTGEFTDWHSPMMTEVWRVVGRVIAGPAGMLVLQSLLLLLGAYHLLRRALGGRGAAIAAVCVLLFPPVLATTSLISAEAQLASFAIAGAAALASPRRWVRVVGLGLMVIACGTRPGAALAVIPIVLAMFHWHEAGPHGRRIAIGAAASVLVFLLAWGLDRAFIDVRSERDEVALAMGDIIGTLHHAPTVDDAEARRLLDGVRLATVTGIQQRARSLDGKLGSYAATDQRLFELPVNQAERDALYAARRAVARAAPASYLEHRRRLFFRELGFARSQWWPLHTDFIAHPSNREVLRHAARHSLLQAQLVRGMRLLSATFLFRPSLYFVLALVLLPLAAARRQRDSLVLLASAVLYELSLMFVALRPEYRDSHWMIAGTVTAIALMIARGRAPSEVRDERVLEQAPLGVAQDDHA